MVLSLTITVLGPVATAPGAFSSTQWTLADAGTNGTAALTIIALPDSGGAVITDIEYRANGGAWVSLGSAATAVYYIGSLTNDASSTIAIRAVNSVGAGNSDSKTVTPTEAPTAPSAFTAGQWTLSDTGTGDTLTLGISALPSSGGSEITALQYQLNGGAWTALSGVAVGTYSITSTTGVLASILIRAVNIVGNGPASDTKLATATTPPSTLVLTGTLSITEPGATGAGAYSCNSTARHYWSLTGSGTTPNAAEIVAGTGAFANGFFDVHTGSPVEAITFPTNIDVAGGVLSVVAVIEPAGEVSNILRDTSVNVNTVPPAYRTFNNALSFEAGSSDGLSYSYTANTFFTAAGIDAGRTFVWAWYYDGTDGTGAPICIQDRTQSDVYIALQCDSVVFRADGQTDRTSVAMGLPSSPGWQFCVAYVKWGATNPGDGTKRLQFWRNGVQATPYTGTSATGISGPELFNGLSVGLNDKSTADDRYFNGEVSDFAILSGRATDAFASFLYNGGAFGRRVTDYDLAGNGLAVLDAIPLKATNPAALANTDAALQSTNSTFVTPTLRGVPAWKAIVPPSEIL